MKVPVRLDDIIKDARILYIEESQFGFLDEWRESLGDDTNPIRIDAVNFATFGVQAIQCTFAVRKLCTRYR